MLGELTDNHGSSFIEFMLASTRRAHDSLLAMPWSTVQQQRYVAMAEESVRAQQRIEDADTLSFEEWRQRYMDPANLN